MVDKDGPTQFQSHPWTLPLDLEVMQFWRNWGKNIFPAKLAGAGVAIWHLASNQSGRWILPKHHFWSHQTWRKPQKALHERVYWRMLLKGVLLRRDVLSSPNIWQQLLWANLCCSQRFFFSGHSFPYPHIHICCHFFSLWCDDIVLKKGVFSRLTHILCKAWFLSSQ